MTKKRTIDFHEEDEAFLVKFNDQVDMLAGMVVEMIEEKPSTLLSPLFRRMLLDKAKEVQSLHSPLKRKLAVDNPCDPLVALTS